MLIDIILWVVAIVALLALLELIGRWGDRLNERAARREEWHLPRDEWK